MPVLGLSTGNTEVSEMNKELSPGRKQKRSTGRRANYLQRGINVENVKQIRGQVIREGLQEVPFELRTN